ncbi:O-antigen ligase-like membrane protein [Polaribacter sp. Hel1_33_96]|jgi:O-antigen ligase|uniref:O-antigen ligase family protein n=2 Tax=Polaribacter TaxID=52959 RepID=UPI00052D6584|nr:O-antigen polymerase [Polaribacter sp. Hel1_33_49]PKV63838.1 O-antigen ligase-like membrane protein [Polaribacter sp. Hel1_33_96]
MVRFFKELKLKEVLRLLFLNLFLFPIYPDNIKPSLIVLFFIASIIFAYKNNSIPSLSDYKHKRLLILNSSLFLVLFVSLVYSDNLKFGLNYILRLSPLIIFPISFFLLRSHKVLFSQNTFKKAKSFFYFSTLLLFINIFILFYFEGFVTKNYFLNYSYRIIFQLGKYSMHPIYASLIISISLIFSISLIKIKKYKWFILFGNMLLIGNLILLSRKSAILIMSAFFFSYIFFNKKIQLKRKVIFILLSFIIGLSIVKFTPDISNRFKDINHLFDATKISSTNIRFNLTNLAIKAIKEKPIFGYGVGDTKDVLSILEQNNFVFKNKYYNSHNQFLGLTISTGFFGLLIFMNFLIRNLKNSFLVSFEQFSVLLFFTVLMLIENILDRQNGVIYFALIINYFSFYNQIDTEK